jgi:hypothetical protein
MAQFCQLKQTMSTSLLNCLLTHKWHKWYIIKTQEMKNFLKEIMKTNAQKKNRRVVVYVPDEDYNMLKSQLALTHKNVSRWVREKIKEYLLKGEN